jgi:hypothetical protein
LSEIIAGYIWMDRGDGMGGGTTALF